MTVIYFADGLRAAQPDTQPRTNGLNRWLPGVKPGELANSPRNVLLYKKGE